MSARRIGIQAILVAAAALFAWPSLASAQYVNSAPTISGTAQIGKTLTANGGDAGGPSGVIVDYVWLRCDQSSTAPERCTWLTRNTGKAYVVTSDDNGKYLRVARVAFMWWDMYDMDDIRWRASNPTARVTTVPVATPTPTPVKTPTPTPTPVKTPTPTATPVKTPTPTPTPVKTPSATGTVTPAGTVPPAATPAPTPTFDLGVQPTPEVAPTAQPDPTAPSGGVLGAAETKKAKMFKPLPVVRIRGRLTTNGANIQVLSVKAPKGAKITVKCSGKGCPRKSVATATATKVTRISQFQRVLPAGIKLRITIAKPGYISKVTTISIRKGKAPLRSDQCQVPGEKKLLRC